MSEMRLEIGQGQTVSDLEALRGGILAMRGHDAVLDMSGVKRMTTLLMQVLMSGHATWAEDGKAFRLANLPAGMDASLTLLGATQLMQNPET